jgi:hypothetical protein
MPKTEKVAVIFLLVRLSSRRKTSVFMNHWFAADRFASDKASSGLSGSVSVKTGGEAVNCRIDTRRDTKPRLVKQLVNKALSNDPKAAAQVLDQIRRSEGMNMQEMKMNMTLDKFEAIARQLAKEL